MGLVLLNRQLQDGASFRYYTFNNPNCGITVYGIENIELQKPCHMVRPQQRQTKLLEGQLEGK